MNHLKEITAINNLKGIINDDHFFDFFSRDDLSFGFYWDASFFYFYLWPFYYFYNLSSFYFYFPFDLCFFSFSRVLSLRFLRFSSSYFCAAPSSFSFGCNFLQSMIKVFCLQFKITFCLQLLALIDHVYTQSDFTILSYRERRRRMSIRQISTYLRRRSKSEQFLIFSQMIKSKLQMVYYLPTLAMFLIFSQKELWYMDISCFIFSETSSFFSSFSSVYRYTVLFQCMRVINLQEISKQLLRPIQRIVAQLVISWYISTISLLQNISNSSFLFFAYPYFPYLFQFSSLIPLPIFSMSLSFIYYLILLYNFLNVILDDSSFSIIFFNSFFIQGETFAFLITQGLSSTVSGNLSYFQLIFLIICYQFLPLKGSWPYNILYRIIPIDHISHFYALYVFDSLSLSFMARLSTSGDMYFILPTLDYVRSLFLPDLH